MSALRVLLIDEHHLVRAGLVAALSQEGYDVVGDHADGRAGERAALHLQPDVVVVSATLPDRAGAAVCAAVKEATDARVIVLGAAAQPDALLAAVEAGADGFLSENEGLADLLAALERVARGEAVVPPALLGPLLRGLITRNRREERALEQYMRLTRREKEVLALLAEGCDHETVADILVISPLTARTHIQNVLGKLEVHSRAEAAAFAAEHGLTDRLTARRVR